MENKCESCGAELKDLFPGQYDKVCFKCWDSGNFDMRKVGKLIQRQHKAYVKKGLGKEWEV